MKLSVYKNWYARITVEYLQRDNGPSVLENIIEFRLF